MLRPSKTADILRPHYWFPREMSEKKVQKFHTDDVPLGLSLLIGSREFPTRHDQSGTSLRFGQRHVNSMLLGWFNNRTGTSVDNCARKPNNWLDQWQKDNLGTESRIECFPRWVYVSYTIRPHLLSSFLRHQLARKPVVSPNVRCSCYDNSWLKNPGHFVNLLQWIQ